MNAVATGGAGLVEIGGSEYGRFISVTPPLDSDEINTLEWVGILEPGDVTQIEESDETGSPASLIAVEEQPLQEDTMDIAIDKSARIACGLARLRDGYVTLAPTPEELLQPDDAPLGSELVYDA